MKRKKNTTDDELALIAELVTVIDANEKRLTKLAARLPGGKGGNYIVTLMDFVASEYKCGVDAFAALDDRQLIALVEAALRRKGGETGRAAESSVPWEGDAWDNAPAQVRRVLRYMHGREEAKIADLVEAVWEETYEKVNDNRIHVAISRANTFLRKCREPRWLKKVRGEAIIRWV